MPDRLRTPCCNWHSRIALDESSPVAAALLVPHVPLRRPPQHINVRLSGRIRKTTDTVSVRHLSPRECLRTPAMISLGTKLCPQDRPSPTLYGSLALMMVPPGGHSSSHCLMRYICCCRRLCLSNSQSNNSVLDGR